MGSWPAPNTTCSREFGRIAGDNNLRRNLCGLYDNYGVIREMDTRLDSAEHYYRKALKLKIALQDTYSIPFAPQRIEALLHCEHDRLQVSIRDDDTGFDPEFRLAKFISAGGAGTMTRHLVAALCVAMQSACARTCRRSKCAVPARKLHLLQRLHQIVHQIVDVLDADREPHQPFRDAGFG